MRDILLHLFTPHPNNNHRARILHPTGLTILISILVLAQISLQVWMSLPQAPMGMVLGFTSSISISQVVDLTNVERIKQNLPPVEYNPILSRAAQQKASHMFEHNYWAHIAPDGTTPWDFFRQAGYRYTVAGENLARDFGASEPMMNAWMASPTHRDNIVNPSFQEIGVAVVQGTLQGVETTLVVQLFGASAQAVPITTDVLDGAAGETLDAVALDQSELTAPALNELALADEFAYEALESEQVSQDSLGLNISQLSDSDIQTITLSPLQISKAISLAMILLVMLVLLYDTAHQHVNQTPRMRGKNWAHVMLFAIVVLLIVSVGQGAIL